MNGLADYEAIVASGAMEVLSTVQIRIFRGSRDIIGAVHLDLKDRVAAWDKLSKFQAFRTVEVMNLGDVVESCGQEIPTISVELSDIQFEFAPGQMETLKDCAIRGVLDGAAIYVDRWVSTVGWQAEEFNLHDFGGYIEQAQPTEFGVVLSCKAWIGKLAAASYPRHLVSPWCRHELGDALCGVSAPDIEVGPRTGSTRTRILAWAPPGTFDGYRGGTFWLATGRNAGYARTIERIEDLGPADGGNNNWALHVAPPGFPFPIASTDYGAIRKACDKTLETCRNVFNNEARHGGFPFVPPPESV